MGKLRITGGEARGRLVEVPDAPGVRPTSGRVREALFSILGQDLSGQTVLDAFGGSGMLALEAWSRGARVRVVERDPRVARAIQATAGRLRADIEVMVGDVRSLAPQLGTVDGVLADPPYADDALPTLEALGPRVRDWLVLEAAASAVVPSVVGRLRCPRVRSFGDTALHVFWCGGEGGDGA